jgi:hypothetical protein
MSETQSPYRIVEPITDANGTTRYQDVSQPQQPDPMQQRIAAAVAPIVDISQPRIPGEWLAWVELPEDCEYAGGRVYAWINFPKALDRMLNSGDQERAAKAFSKIVRAHEGLADVAYDDEGEPLLDEFGKPRVEAYPPAGTAEFFEAIPNRLVFLIMAAISGKVITLPASMDQRKRR